MQPLTTSCLILYKNEMHTNIHVQCSSVVHTYMPSKSLKTTFYKHTI